MALGLFKRAGPRVPIVARYLQRMYWWADVDPKVVAVFELGWLVGAIVFDLVR